MSWLIVRTSKSILFEYNPELDAVRIKRGEKLFQVSLADVRSQPSEDARKFPPKSTLDTVKVLALNLT